MSKGRNKPRERGLSPACDHKDHGACDGMIVLSSDPRANFVVGDFCRCPCHPGADLLASADELISLLSRG